MKVEGSHYRAIWLAQDGASVDVIDQTKLPHSFEILNLKSRDDAIDAIKRMVVRGAPLIGVTAAYGYALAMADDASDRSLNDAYEKLFAARPTAVNLRWALDDLRAMLVPLREEARCQAAFDRAGEMANEDVETNHSIGGHGVDLIKSTSEANGGKTVNILTHCNAGWLATVDWGTALSPIYQAHDAGISVHVWADETRPRNQGAALTAWELGAHGVPHTVVVDNVGGHLMQHGMVDLCITGTDRTTASGDVCNKIGTYLKALAASDNNVPFYVALPHSTIDWRVHDGVKEIPIEERASEEVTHIAGTATDGSPATVRLTPEGTAAANYAFDVTPARLVTGLITERGVCEASREGLADLYPDLAS